MFFTLRYPPRFPGIFRVSLPVLFLAVSLTSSVPVWADEAGGFIPLDLQIHIFLKIMTYDRNLHGKALDLPYHVGVLQTEEQQSRKPELLKRIEGAVRQKTLLGRKILVQSFTSVAAVAGSGTSIPHLLLIVDEQVSEWAAIDELSRKRNIVTGSICPGHRSKPVGIVLTLEREEPVIWLNLDLVRQSGADFHANFLKHCRVRQ